MRAAKAARRGGRARGQRAGHRLSRIAEGAGSTRRCSSSRCAAGATGSAGMADLLVTPAAEVLPAFVPRDRIVEIEWGADTDRFAPGAPRARAVHAGGRARWWRSSPARSARGTARSTSCAPCATLRAARARATSMPCSSATARSLPGRGPRPTGSTASRSPAPCATTGCRRASRPRTSASRRSTSAAHPPLQLAFYWSPLKVFEYMAAGLPVVAPAHPAPGADPRAGARAPALRPAGAPGARRRAGVRWPTTRTSAAGWATAARRRVLRASSAGRRTAGNWTMRSAGRCGRRSR